MMQKHNFGLQIGKEDPLPNFEQILSWKLGYTIEHGFISLWTFSKNVTLLKIISCLRTEPR
jgi:hypothetical protein